MRDVHVGVAQARVGVADQHLALLRARRGRAPRSRWACRSRRRRLPWSSSMPPAELSLLNAEEQAVVDVVRHFVDREVRPVVRELEHANTYPEALIEQMKELGIFGLAIPEPYGEAPVSMPCYALVTEELARGWMSLAGRDGRAHRRRQAAGRVRHRRSSSDRYLPRMATGELRATMALTEPGGGSDLQAMTHDRASRRRRALRRQRREDLDHQLAPLAADRAAVQDRPGRRARAPGHHRSCWSSTAPGSPCRKDLPKLGYKGVESCELSFDGLPRARRRAARRRRGPRASRR